MRILIKKTAYSRLKRLRKKQADRLRKVREVFKELSIWSDIPISWQMNSICKILGIVKNQSAEDFVLKNFLLSNASPEEIAKRLPLP